MEFGLVGCREFFRTGLGSDDAFTFVVIASIGRDRLDTLFPKVMARDGDLVEALRSEILSLITEAVSDAASVAFEILSRATWVTGAALLGQLLYHDCWDFQHVDVKHGNELDLPNVGYLGLVLVEARVSLEYLEVEVPGKALVAVRQGWFFAASAASAVP